MKKKMNLLKLSSHAMEGVNAGRNCVTCKDGTTICADCCCACAYATTGGSSTSDNASANYDSGLWSPQCEDC